MLEQRFAGGGETEMKAQVKMDRGFPLPPPESAQEVSQSCWRGFAYHPLRRTSPPTQASSPSCTPASTSRWILRHRLCLIMARRFGVPLPPPSATTSPLMTAEERRS
nr:hypothetical protein CFP56_21766 [Quercus suber]